MFCCLHRLFLLQKLKANYEKCVIGAIAAMDNNTDMRLRFGMDGKYIIVPITLGVDNTTVAPM
jgi:hypothetical protein